MRSLAATEAWQSEAAPEAESSGPVEAAQEHDPHAGLEAAVPDVPPLAETPGWALSGTPEDRQHGAEHGTGLAGPIEGIKEEGPGPRLEGAPPAAPSGSGSAVAEVQWPVSGEDAEEAPSEFFAAVVPAGDPECLAPLLAGPAPEPTAAMDSCAAEAVAPGEASRAEAAVPEICVAEARAGTDAAPVAAPPAGIVPIQPAPGAEQAGGSAAQEGSPGPVLAPEDPDEGAPEICVAEAGAGTDAAPVAAPPAGIVPIQPAPGAAQAGGSAAQEGSPGPVLAPEDDDEFELVDAETAGRMLDRLIDAARSAIRSSFAAPAQEQPSGEKAQPAESCSAVREETSAAAEFTESEDALRPGTREDAVQPPRLLSGRPAFDEEELGQEPPPLPPAAALIGMGLPERLRARLESIGDLDKVLGAQSDSAAGKAVDQRGRLLVFRVGEEHYGLPLENVREVERVTRVTPVPGAPRFVRGLVNLRGEILPLVDMRLLLGAGAEELPPSPRLVVAQADGKEPPLALMVEELNGLAPVGEEVEETAPEETRRCAGVRGALQHRGRRVWRLDPAAVISLAALEERAELR